jgi:DNA-binding MarR family transcriptional regulator
MGIGGSSTEPGTGSGVEMTADLLHSAAIHVLRAVRATDETDGLSPARLSALSVLAFRGPITVKELAAAEGISSPSATSLLNGLDAAGMVSRSPSTTDRRAVLVAITAEGQRAFDRARSRRLDALARILSPLEADDLRTIERAAQILGRALSQGQARG